MAGTGTAEEEKTNEEETKKREVHQPSKRKSWDASVDDDEKKDEK
jgi:hypothetical protein